MSELETCAEGSERQIRRALSCAVEEYELIETVTRSCDEDWMPSPWCEVVHLERVERDCGCGLTELGWFYIDRPLYGANVGVRIPCVRWDGCSCGRGRQLSSGRYPRVEKAA